MGLIKSKREKEMQQRILIKRTMANINKHIGQLEVMKQKYIEAAKTAKMKGADAQYNLAVSGLKSALAQQKKAEEMLLNFELTSQMKDLTATTANFLNGMSVLSKEMAKITNKSDFIKVQQQFENAMMGLEESSEKLDLFMDTSESSFTSFASDSSKIDDAEIERLIDIQSSDAEKGMEAEIDQKLEEIKKSISSK